MAWSSNRKTTTRISGLIYLVISFVVANYAGVFGYGFSGPQDVAAFNEAIREGFLNILIVLQPVAALVVWVTAKVGHLKNREWLIVFAGLVVLASVFWSLFVSWLYVEVKSWLLAKFPRLGKSIGHI